MYGRWGFSGGRVVGSISSRTRCMEGLFSLHGASIVFHCNSATQPPISQREVVSHCPDPSHAAGGQPDTKQLFIVFLLCLVPDEVHWSPKQSMPPRPRIICFCVEMIGLFPTLGISCNYWGGISGGGVMNDRLTLFVLADHWLPLPPFTQGFYFLYSVSHKHRGPLKTSSITWTENHWIETHSEIWRAKQTGPAQNFSTPFPPRLRTEKQLHPAAEHGVIKSKTCPKTLKHFSFSFKAKN